MFKPWVKEEGLYVTSRFQRFKAKMGMKFHMDFLTKSMLKDISDLPDDEFEKTWQTMKEQNKTVEAYVKYDDKGRIIEVCSNLDSLKA